MDMVTLVQFLDKAVFISHNINILVKIVYIQLFSFQLWVRIWQIRLVWHPVRVEGLVGFPSLNAFQLSGVI